ncbi:MAG TPA: translesion error-prone DNA polymerase V autoproteolytic subunit [Emticicia sp.]
MNPKLCCGGEFLIEFYRSPDVLTTIKRPFFLQSVQAGFPSPARDDVEWKDMDLNELLVERPSSTFFFRTAGNSMIGAGILDKSILIVDRSIKPRDGMIVLAVLYGEYTVKYYREIDCKVYLMPANDAFPNIEIRQEMDFSVWGVVTGAVNQLIRHRKK